MGQPDIDIHYDSPPPGSRPLRSQVTELRAKIERLRLTEPERALLAMLAEHPVTHELMSYEVALLRGVLARHDAT